MSEVSTVFAETIQSYLKNKTKPFHQSLLRDCNIITGGT